MKNIIESYKHSVTSIIKNFTGTQNEDIEQEVYVKVWNFFKARQCSFTVSRTNPQGSKKIEETNKFQKWINVVTANTCRDYLRSKSAKMAKNSAWQDEAINSIKDNSLNPEKILDTKERQKAILKAVNKLPKKLKEIIFLFEFEERTYEEISKKLNIPIGTVKSRLYNARNELKTTLLHLIGD